MKTAITATVRAQRAIQAEVKAADLKHKKKPPRVGAMQAGARKYPAPPMPVQHHAKPGREASLNPAPMLTRRSIGDRENSKARWR